MAIDRKTFISNMALGGGSLLVPGPGTGTGTEEEGKPDFTVPSDFSITYLATRWGFAGTLEEFCSAAKEEGYDGIEVWIPGTAGDREKLLQVTRDHGLDLALLVGSGNNNFEDHFEEFKDRIRQAVEMEPLLINCHAGRDFFPFEQNRKIIEHTVEVSRRSGIGISHETHRSRILFAAHLSRRFIEEIPGISLTLDISHWCNVHESLLGNQPDNVQAALDHTDHVHSRVGHPEGPQVTDPRAPEWQSALNAHLAWWDRVVKRKIDQGDRLTVTPEFGPPSYMPAVPYTGQPLADQWEINSYMMELWKKRYS